MATIREAAVAGSFYPGRPGRLEGLVRGLISGARAAETETLRGLIVPHAGYQYSGAVAATAYRLLAGRAFSRVVLVGPSHFVPVQGAALSDATSFRTPLGLVDIDTEAVTRMSARPGLLVDPVAHAQEHSLETQLPFLQVILADFRLLPVAMGRITPDLLADALEPELTDDALLVVSSDLSHYHDHDTARRLDEETAAAIETGDSRMVTEDRACGAAGIKTAMVLSARRGWRCRLLDLRTSADTAGDRSRVVGYGAFSLGPVRLPGPDEVGTRRP